MDSCFGGLRNDPPPSLPLPTQYNEEYVDTLIIYRAMFDFEPVGKDDLSLAKGDELQIINRYVPDAPGWWKGRNLRTGSTGVIPSNFLTPIPQTFHNLPDVSEFSSELWWFDIGRSEANKLLILPGNSIGSFLVRMSTENAYRFTLSVRNYSSSTEENDLQHYEIKFMPRTSEYYINQRAKLFRSLSGLIDYYQGNSDGLCCQLKQPCAREATSIHFKTLEIERSRIELIAKLGEGRLSDVWLGRYKNKVDVVVRQIKAYTVDRDELLTDAKTMHGVPHRRLVQLMGVVTQSKPFLVIVELVKHGSLRKYLKADMGSKIRFETLLDIASQIAQGMAHLERNDFIHLDLRAHNVFVGTGNRIKVDVIGLAKVLPDDFDFIQDTKSPVRWVAPEGALDQTFTIKSNVWSYGVLLYELVTYGRKPYAGMTEAELMDKLCGGYRLPNPEHKNYKFIVCPPKMYDMMLMCWSATPEKRPTFEYLRNFFEDYYTETEDTHVVQPL